MTILTRNNKPTCFIFLLAVCLLYFIGQNQYCFAQPITSSDLIQEAGQYDGKTISYRGEAIGEVMKRGNFCWVNIHDGKNAIGIWLSGEQAGEIRHTGNYRSIGDEIEVVGIFHRACPEHGGDLDIHAESLRKVASGRIVKERLNTAKRNMAFYLLGAVIAIWILNLFIRR
jgi:hypothetical protein